MKQVILVAHGEGNPSFSIPKVKTITPANTALSFQTAKEYMDSDQAWPEYASTSFGEFSPLSDDDCRALFGKIPKGDGIVSTGLRRGKDVGGVSIFALRVHDINAENIMDFITTNSITSMILLACRERSDKTNINLSNSSVTSLFSLVQEHVGVALAVQRDVSHPPLHALALMALEAADSKAPATLAQMLEDQKKAPGSTSVAAVDQSDITPQDWQHLQDILLLNSFINVFGMQKVYKDHGDKAYDITKNEQAAAFTQACASALNYVITSAMGGFLNLRDQTAQSITKTYKKAEFHLGFLSDLFKAFAFPESTLTALDGVLNAVVDSLTKIEFNEQEKTVDHLLFMYVFEKVPGMDMKLPHLRLFYLKIDTKSWKISMCKSTVTEINFQCNYIDENWEMNPFQVAKQRDQIQALLTKMSGLSMEQLDNKLTPSVVDTGKPK